jgi:diphthine synthase
MLYLIGLGMNPRGISKEGMLALEECKKIYLEGYTVDFPYKIDELNLGTKRNKIIRLGRADVESDKLIKEAKSIKLALLVYGSPLFATTHISLILDAKKEGVRTRVIYSASIFDALAETGLQLYKFGKTTSMPAWGTNFEPDFMLYVKENQGIHAHSLILVDIGLEFQRALVQLKENAAKNKVKLDKIVVCSSLGTEYQEIYYGPIEAFKRKVIDRPFCFIVPEDMHFIEKEAVERFLVK